MDGDLIQAVLYGIGPIAGLVTGYLGYRLARRRNSGKIDTTDADALWREAGQLRREYQNEITRLQKVVADLQGHIEEYDEQNRELRGQVDSLRNEGLQKDQKIKTLQEENKYLSRRVEELTEALQAQIQGARTAGEKLSSSIDISRAQEEVARIRADEATSAGTEGKS